MRRYTILFLLLIPFITFTLAITLPMFVASAVTLYPISGKVTDYNTGLPLANISVRWVSGSLWSMSSGLTNSKGNYKFDVMPGTQYVDAYDFKNEEYVGGVLKADCTVLPWYIFLVDRSKVRLITVNSPVKGLNIKLKNGYEITGTITDIKGNPVPNWTVEVRINDHGTWYYGNTIKAGGSGNKGDKFFTHVLPSGVRVELRIRAKGYSPVNYYYNTSTVLIDPIPISSKDISIKVALKSLR